MIDTFDFFSLVGDIVESSKNWSTLCMRWRERRPW